MMRLGYASIIAGGSKVWINLIWKSFSCLFLILLISLNSIINIPFIIPSFRILLSYETLHAKGTTDHTLVRDSEHVTIRGSNIRFEKCNILQDCWTLQADWRD